ncbi:hypothetical protein [Nocardia lasii]|uniref:Uncharacterized protein n=1 Tax=Nocardia lasii TaxID=1616107 RepID=A0ABW1JP36_9NOCA
MPTIETLHGRLRSQFADRVAHSDSAAGELAFHNGVAVRLWIENHTLHAELDSLQGGPELWLLGPDADDLDDFLDTVDDASNC